MISSPRAGPPTRPPRSASGPSSVNAGYMVTALRWQIYRLDGSLGEHRDEMHATPSPTLSTCRAPSAPRPSAASRPATSPRRGGWCARLVTIGLDAMAHDSEWLAGVFVFGRAAIGLGDPEAAEAAYAALAPVRRGIRGRRPRVGGRRRDRPHAGPARRDSSATRQAARAHLEAALAAHRRTGSPVLTAEAEAELGRLDAIRARPTAGPAGKPAGDARRRRVPPGRSALADRATRDSRPWCPTPRAWATWPCCWRRRDGRSMSSIWST